MPGSNSCIRCRSEWHAPAAPTCTSTSPGPGSGTGTSSSTGSLFHWFRRSARMSTSSGSPPACSRRRPRSRALCRPSRGPTALRTTPAPAKSGGTGAAEEDAMTEQRTTAHGPTIVVGVGPEEFESALAFAAAEAVRAGCGLHLVHAVDLTPIPADHVLIPAADVEAWGAARLAEAVKVADDLVGDAVPVTHELVRGTPVGALVEVGRTARMVVLEHRHLSRLSTDREPHRRGRRGRAPPGARGRRPERVATRRGAAGGRRRRRRARARGRGAARGARRGARARGPAPARPLVVDSGALRDARSRPRRSEGGRTAPGRRCAPRSTASATCRPPRTPTYGWSRAGPRRCWWSASADAELLVIGRHDPLVPIGSHIGPVARAVLREATCPVLLATPRPHRAAYHP